MSRELSFKALTMMNGNKVLVKDLEYDAFDQICEVKVKTEIFKPYKNAKPREVAISLTLENEEYLFEYDVITGKCKNGEFAVFSIK